MRGLHSCREGKNMAGDNGNDAEQITNEKYKNEIIYIFSKMNDTRKIKFWHKYITSIEKGRV